ncbi:MAG: DUF4129 domain-containing protein [Acidobacteria bacterium]|nr:MAG: DUF4129 domain-containing protein [Acidobacteriota bacterium]REK02838.1 MAG: DUF4129 domain-containing protein [Acidobacteriota bacterium]REK13358.1 MAG: DUF4129 domain-containing protein [Acidobacteriota bacterium]REK41352.1 MAG: DUF4129 domain-containing protein [Acidobacteriota bacterium]
MLSKPIRSAFAAAALTTLLVSFAGQANAKTISEYREEVAHLRYDFEELLGSDGDVEGREEFEGEVFAEVREFVNDPDTVSFGGSDLTAGNSWLLEKINEYASGSKTEEQRTTILNAIYERLGAIENKILEYEGAVADGTAKDETKRRLAEILKGEEFRKATEEADESAFAAVWKWLEEWFRYLFPPRENAPTPMRGPDLTPVGFVLQILLYAAVVLVVAYLLWRFGPKVLKRVKESRNEPKRDRVVLGEKIEAGVTTQDLFLEAERLVAEGRFRDGLRKGYIALLFGLGERKVVGLAKHKTNRDYLKDLEKHGDLKQTVTGLTAQYERHWYGSVEAGEDDWAEFSGGYSKALGRRTK